MRFLRSGQKENLLITGVHVSYWPAFTILSIFLISYWSKTGFSVKQIGLIVTCQSLTNLLTAPIWGVLTDTKISLRKAILICSLLAAPLPFLHLTTSVFWHVLIINMVLSLFSLPLAGLVDAWTYRLAAKNRKIVYGFTRGMGSLISAVVSLLAGIVLNKFGLTMVFPIYAGLMLLVFVFSYFNTETKTETPEITALDSPELSFGSALRYIFENYRYLVFVLSMTLMNIGLRAALTFTPILIEELGGSSFHNGLSMAVNTSMMLPFMLLYTKLSKKHSNKVLMIWAAAFTILRILSLGLAKSLPVLIVFQLLNSASYGFLQPAMLDFVKRHTQSFIHGTSITFITSFIVAISGITGNYVSGVIIERMGISTTFFFLSALAGVGLVLFLLCNQIKGYDAGNELRE